MSLRIVRALSVIVGLTFLATGISACSKAPTLTASLEAEAIVTGAKATVQGALSTPQAGIPIKVEIKSSTGDFVKVGDSKVTDKDGVYKIAFAPSGQGSFDIRTIATLTSGDIIESSSVALKVQSRRVFYKAAGDKYLACTKPVNDFLKKAVPKPPKVIAYGKPARDYARTLAPLLRARAVCGTNFSWPEEVAADVKGLADSDTQDADIYSRIGKTTSADIQKSLKDDLDGSGGSASNRIRLALGLPKRPS